jgi:hypothetical protein
MVLKVQVHIKVGGTSQVKRGGGGVIKSIQREVDGVGE